MSKEYEILQKIERIIIYGAANNAKDAIFTIDTLFPSKIIGIAVTRKTKQADELFGYTIKQIEEYKQYAIDGTVVVVAMRPDYYEEVKESLLDMGYLYILSYGDNNGLMQAVNDKLIKYAKNNGKNYYELRNEWKLQYIRKVARKLQLESDDG